MNVETIGATTHGKPVGMYSWEYCDIVIAPIAFEGLNAEGEGRYYEGFEPTCPAEDLLTASLGDEAETSLAEALHLLQSGSCSAGTGGSGSKCRHPQGEIPRHGFRLEVGSY